MGWTEFWWGVAILGVFFVSDLVYALDHYLVHFDRERYARTHSIHHRRYNGRKNERHLDHSELTTYGSAALMSACATSALTLLTGNPGFFLGSVLKFVHTLLFHHYQHRWWSEVAVRKQGLPKATSGWGIASANYHAYHHSHPDDLPFTYAETWKGFDRILEWLHPWLLKLTVDGQAGRIAAKVMSRDAARGAKTVDP